MNKENYKFDIGDQVKVIKCGCGIRYEDKGVIVTIVKQGNYPYPNHLGYVVDPPIGNSRDYLGAPYFGFIGEESFELVEKGEPQYELY
jgi:hypothetical protein